MSTVKVRSALTRNYGAYTYTAEVETEVVGDEIKGTDVLAEQDKHLKLLRMSITEFETYHLRALPGRAPKKPLPTIDQDKKGDDGSKGQWVKALGIVSEHKKGTTYYYVKTVKGTKWSTHGCSMYFDNFEGMTELEFEKRAKNGELVLPEDFYVAIISRPGKPDRAVAIAHKDTIEAEV